MNFRGKIGVLGGSFDPAHKGHLAISKEAKKILKLKKVIWAITEKNPISNYFTTTIFNFLQNRITKFFDYIFMNKNSFSKISKKS